MTRTPDLDFLADLIKKAIAAGADAADTIYGVSTSIAHSQRLGRIDKLERSEGHDLGLRVMVGRRQASVSSNDLDPATLDEMVQRAVAMAKAVPEDPHCGLADPDQIARDFPDLDLADPNEPSPETLIDRARAAEDAALAVDGITNSEGAEAHWGRTTVLLATSNGFAGTYSRTSHSVSAVALAGEGTAMERDYDYATAVHGEDLEDPEEIGRAAAERTLRRLNPRKAKTAQVPILFEPRVAASLIGHFAGAINGASVARGTSFLKDRLGEPVFPANVSIVDDPHRRRGLASKPFDGEGLANRLWTLVDGGILTTWLLDLATARQLGMAPTGHAARGSGGPPGPSTTNLHLAAGNAAPEDMIAEIDAGLYVHEVMGPGVNLVTGDYSRGCAGFWIEKGEIAYPVSEITIAGNLAEMFRNLSPASDLTFRRATNAPTVRVDGMTVAGS